MVYRRALGIVIRAAGLNVIEEVPLNVHFRGEVIGRFYADLVVDGVVLIEIKAAAHVRALMRSRSCSITSKLPEAVLGCC